MNPDQPALAGVDRAAVLLMALGEDHAADLLRHFEPRELHRIGASMTALRHVEREQVAEIVASFTAQVANENAMTADTHTFVKNVLTRAIGRDKAKNLMDRILNADGSTGVEALKWMEAKAVAAGLRREHPQVIALVLSYLESEQAAEVLGLLPDDLRYDVLMRVATLDSVPTVAIGELNDVIEKQVMRNINAATSFKVGGPKRAAEILNLLDSGVEGAIMEKLKVLDEGLAVKIEDLMVVFEHLLNVDDRGIQNLLREISSETLLIALRGADEGVREKILKNMSKRAAEMMRDDLESMGPVRLIDVEAAQKEIMSVAKRMAEAGDLALGGGGGGGGYV
ncbi:flagellar motor switch protein FliG [Plasticicumulans lactativorans]|uniref:Flagellar motor switch protein FliG n=1 Tax=Plasticicumulans lactativorans TaxID=1133106 RepID=A0A4R2L203_9GAMM|nr:flagellar motor switch protein FliG [Plasticicumulans lactativorans]TCO81081.1 flagellar motor switch protein FliG [Plasticicumulans lactativorans]